MFHITKAAVSLGTLGMRLNLLALCGTHYILSPTICFRKLLVLPLTERLRNVSE